MIKNYLTADIVLFFLQNNYSRLLAQSKSINSAIFKKIGYEPLLLLGKGFHVNNSFKPT